MPGWMQAMATVNPVAHATDALRGHVLGTATTADTATALVAAIGLWVAVTVVPVLARRVRPARVR
jgi:ABC-2 type transport system permease protein